MAGMVEDAGVRAEVGRLLAVLPGAEVRDEEGRDFPVVAWGPGGEVLAAVVREGLVTASLTLRHADDLEAFRGFLVGMAARDATRARGQAAGGTVAGEVVLYDAEGRERARVPAYGDGRDGLVTTALPAPITAAFCVVLLPGFPPRPIPLGYGGIAPEKGLFAVAEEGTPMRAPGREEGT